MILEYHRPKSIDEALHLLGREFPPTIPLGGGNRISRHSADNVAVVDLQNLGLNKILVDGMTAEIGATVTLEQLCEHQAIPEELKKATRMDATANTRNTATIGGMIAAGGGGCATLNVLLAMDARLEWLPGESKQALGEFISLKQIIRPGKIITGVQIPLQAQVGIASVGRSPLDAPVLIVVVCRWPSGRTRLVLGGKVKAPILAMDGTTQDGIIEAGVNACSHLSNQWASIKYLENTTSKLIQRLTKA